ncbi:hypothetical protein [Gordoniibacillus kamchatkensis]|uniref:hypothetical protein n=1 Tax=Gordoniibacillus kamchatkensis TaxID=1590651 RepID=UPI000A4AB3B2|nr:hypothetical protein [Paenibacillus sp. VKM B-2647]
MESGLPSRLKLRLFGIYVGLGLLTSVGMLLSNIFISRYAWNEVWWSFAGVLAGYSILIAVLQLITRNWFAQPAANEQKRSAELRLKLWMRLMDFPSVVFWCVFIFGTAATQVFYVIMYATVEPFAFSVLQMLGHVKRTVFATTSFAAIAFIHYSVIRCCCANRCGSSALPEPKDTGLLPLPSRWPLRSSSRSDTRR